MRQLLYTRILLALEQGKAGALLHETEVDLLPLLLNDKKMVKGG